MENNNTVNYKLVKYFNSAIKEATNNLRLITGTDAAYKKARVCAELAKAIAFTGCVTQEEVDKILNAEEENINQKQELVDEKEIKKDTKDNLKRKTVKEVDITKEIINKEQDDKNKVNNKKKELVDEPKTEVKENEEQKETATTTVKSEEVTEEFTNEWTDESIKFFEKELEFIKSLEAAYGKEAINSCVEIYTDNIYHSIEDINPLNIKGFVSLLKQFSEESNEQAVNQE